MAIILLYGDSAATLMSGMASPSSAASPASGPDASALFAPFLALFASSLMLRTRSELVAWSRVVLGGVLVATLMWSESSFSTAAAPGLEILSVLTRIAAIGLGAVVLMSAASAITEEKQQHTLSLLRLTGLSAAGILSAKALARICECWMLLAVSLPMALIAATLGGVAVFQILAVYVALATWFVFLISLGLFWSAWLESGSASAGASLGSLAVVGLALVVESFIVNGTPKTGAAAPAPTGIGGVLIALGDLTVFARLGRVLATGFSGGITDPSDWLHLELSAGLWFAAWLVFPAVGTEDVAVSANPWFRPRAGQPKQGGWMVPPRAGEGAWAISWKEFHWSCGGRRAQLAGLVALGGMSALTQVAPNGPRFFEMVLMFCAPSLVVLVAFHLAKIFNGELRDRTFDDLIVLPMHPATLFTAKVAAVARFSVPFVVLTGLSAVMSFGMYPEWPVATAAVVAVAGTATLWYGCAFLSLVLPTAFAPATIVALAGTGVGIIGAAVVLPGFSAETKMWTALVLGVMACVELHWAIVERLRGIAEG